MSKNISQFINLSETTSIERIPIEIQSNKITVELVSILLAIVPIILTIGTILGNVFILAAILYRIRNPTKLLIANLALADLLVGIIIMPFAISNIITKSTWIYGQTLCKIWCSMDVICCTASIITLCAISGDRFIGITKPLQYTQIVTRKRVAFTCLAIWIISITILMATVRWSKTDEEGYFECNVGNQLEYAAQSTIASFFIPLSIICILYYKIFQAANRSYNSLTSFVREIFTSNNQRKKELLLSIRIHYGGTKMNACDGECRVFKKQKKTAKILAMVVSAFICCWTPFFILHLLNAITDDELVPNYIMDFFTWLGYFNSMLNPLIYGTRLRSFKNCIRILSNFLRTESNSATQTPPRKCIYRRYLRRGNKSYSCGFVTSLTDSHHSSFKSTPCQQSDSVERKKLQWSSNSNQLPKNTTFDEEIYATESANSAAQTKLAYIMNLKLYNLLNNSKTTDL